MGKYIESNYETIFGDRKGLKVLELGSGTGLGGTHVAKLLHQRN